MCSYLNRLTKCSYSKTKTKAGGGGGGSGCFSDRIICHTGLFLSLTHESLSHTRVRSTWSSKILSVAKSERHFSRKSSANSMSMWLPIAISLRFNFTTSSTCKSGYGLSYGFRFLRTKWDDSDKTNQVVACSREACCKMLLL